MATTHLSDNDLLDRLRVALTGGADKVPEGHHTVGEWAEKWNLKRAQTERLISAGVKSGIMARVTYRAMSTGGIRNVPHYYEL